MHDDHDITFSVCCTILAFIFIKIVIARYEAISIQYRAALQIRDCLVPRNDAWVIRLCYKKLSC
jgi:hypothetical protein